MKTILLIDGENFKGYIKYVFNKNNKDKPVWNKYNFKKLLSSALKGFDVDRIIFYFARIKEDSNTIEKSKQLIEEQRRLKTHLESQKFEVVLSGRVRAHMENTKLSGKPILVFKEKGVDVKIAVDMISFSCDKKADQIILGSSDSDLQPAVSEVKKRGILCVYLGFERNPNKGLSYTSNRTILIRDFEILECEGIENAL